MVRVDDVVADLEVAGWRLNLEVGDLLFGYLCGGTDCCLLSCFVVGAAAVRGGRSAGQIR
jgi:hypothetical protein